MAEQELAQVEAVLLYIAETRLRAQRAATDLETAGGGLHLVAALRDADAALETVHRRLLQGTYFSVGDDQLTLG